MVAARIARATGRCRRREVDDVEFGRLVLSGVHPVVAGVEQAQEAGLPW